MLPRNRVTLVTLGVADLARARQFYQACGWVPHPGAPEGLPLFQMQGAALALFAYLPAEFFTESRVALVISLSLVVVCALAATAGGIIPLVARKLGVDPAVVSAPFITTFVDATGLVVYFLIAGAVLGL